MMQKLLSWLQHPLFFSSPSSSGPATDQSQPFLSAESLTRCPFKGQKKKCHPLLLAGKPDQHCHPTARPRSAAAAPRPARRGRGGCPGSPLPFPAKEPDFRALEVWEGMENSPAPHAAPQLQAQTSCSHRLHGCSSAAVVHGGI